VKVRDFFSDIKTWILLIIFFVGIGTAGAAWIKLPKRVDAVEKKQEETKDQVQSVAQTLEKYIEIEKVKDEEKEKSNTKKEELMYKWIEQVSKK